MKRIENTFPKFSKIEPEDYFKYQDFLYKFPQHCDFSLNNMLIWLAGNSHVDHSWINSNLVLRINNTIYGNQLKGSWVTILGDTEADKSINEIFRTLSIDKLIMVPDYFVNSIKKSESFMIEEDKDNRDYILDISSLLKRDGKKYQDFRYQINFFLNNYSEETVIRDMDLQDTSDSNVIIEALRAWPKVNSFGLNGNDPSRVDEKAIKRLVELQPILPIKHKCIGLYVNNRLQGFSIYHIPYSKDNIALGNHIKYNDDFKRTFDFLVFATASRLKSEGIRLLNAEQDMGIGGLRKHKLHWQPKMFYKKYIISRI